jgi:hypothetical protein
MGKYCCWVLAQHNLLHNHHNQPLASTEAHSDKASSTLPLDDDRGYAFPLRRRLIFKARILLPRRRNGTMMRAAKAELIDWPRRNEGERMVAEEAVREKRAEKNE